MILMVALLLLRTVQGKVYDRCELARELKFVHNAADRQLATWVCIAEHESQYNTSIVGYMSGDGSGDHGIFQINDKFWCSPPGKGYACGATCAEFEDDNISDDFLCAQRIYKEHKQLSGDGFNAWAVYKPHCKGHKADRYIKDCFNDSEPPKSVTTPSSVFAHGFFDTVAGRVSKGNLLSPGVPAFEPIINFEAPAFTQSTEKPNLDSFLTSKSTIFANNRLFTSTLDPSGDLFFTPPSTTTFRTFTSRTSTYTPPTTTNLVFFNPTARTTTTGTRPSIFQFGNTLRTTTTTSILPTASSRVSNFQFGNNLRAITSTANTRSSISPFGNTFSRSDRLFPSSTPSYQTSTVSQAAPVFIINGVKWY